MPGRPGCRTMEMNGGSFPPLFCTLFTMGGKRSASDYQKQAGIIPLYGGTFTRSYSQQRRRGAAKPGGRGRGIPMGGCSWGHGNTTTPPPHPGSGRDLEVRGGRGIPAVLGGRGSWYSRGQGGGGSWYFRGSGRAALPVGIPEYHDLGPLI